MTALKKVLKKCIAEGPTALDFETTSLVPAEGRARLVSLKNRKVNALVDFDKIKGGFNGCAKLFEKGTWIVFNAGFELRWFMHAGVRPRCLDVPLLRKARLGGGGFSLKQMASWDLDIEMDKTEQAGDWKAKQLTPQQLDYAFGDAVITWDCWHHWADSSDQLHWDGFNTLNDMWPAVIEMEDTGMLIDPKIHSILIKEWEVEKKKRIKRIRKLVGEDEVANLNSDTQWSDYFAARMPDKFLKAWPRTEKSGALSMKGATLKKLAGTVVGTPLEKFFDALAEYKTVSKYLSSFGETLITKAQLAPGNRVRARFNIGAAKTLRFSSSGPNLQQIPRDRELLGKATSVRRSFIAGLGRRLISLDYSGIELRVLALLAGDAQLLQDMIEGDVHSEVAAVIAGHKIDRTTKAGKAARTAAKAVSFGIIYGSGAGGLAVTMRCTIGKAQSYIDFWEKRYPKAFAYRYQMMDEVEKTKFIRMASGCQVYMGKRADLPKCANYPVQHAALAVMAKAIARHKISMDTYRATLPKAQADLTVLLSTIHDALIDEAPTKKAKKVLAIMQEDMEQGFLDVFPGASLDRLVEGQHFHRDQALVVELQLADCVVRHWYASPSRPQQASIFGRL